MTNESIEEAVAFRQTMGRLHAHFGKSRDWFFNTWNADTVKDSKTGKKVRFDEARAEQLGEAATDLRFKLDAAYAELQADLAATL
mgnify:CR=1 FL=1